VECDGTRVVRCLFHGTSSILYIEEELYRAKDLMKTKSKKKAFVKRHSEHADQSHTSSLKVARVRKTSP
jgi:hypothetical protein